MPFAVCLAGAAGEDKLAFMDRLAAALEERGLKVGLVRRASQEAPATGARALVELEPGRLRLDRREVDLALEEVLGRFCYGLDVVLCHGFDQEKRPKLEWLPAGGRPGLAGDPGLRAVIADGEVDTDKPVFQPQDLDGLAEFLVQEVLPQSAPPRLRVVLDGKRIPAKEFVQDILASTIRAMVGSLKGGDRPGRLEIYLEADED